MNIVLTHPRLCTWLTSLIAYCGGVLVAAMAGAADPAFVGVLALTLEKDVAQQLELSEEVQQQILKIVDEREAEAVNLALEIKDLTLSEQAAKLAPFVADSEKRGLALLSDAQKEKLDQVRIKRGGVAALANEQLAAKVGLAPEQREKIAELAQKMSVEMGKLDERRRQTAKAVYERQMMNVLTETQRGAWEKLSGTTTAPLAGVAPAAATPGVPGSPPAATPGGIALPKPATVVPGRAPRVGAEAIEEPEENPIPVEDRVVQFSFKYAPWKEVLEWFAEQADLSLVMNDPPQGTFNYSDRNKYKVPKAIDLLNGILQIKGYTLVRRERMLVLVNLEDGFPPGLVEQVLPPELDKRGEHEVVSCLFTLTKITPEEAEAEIRKLIGPLGSIVVLSKSKQIQVTEAAGKLRTIRAVIGAIEEPPMAQDDTIVEVKLNHRAPSEVLPLARPLLGIADNVNAAPDGSLKFAIDELGSRLLVTGKPEKIDQLQKVIKLLDVNEAGGDLLGGDGPVEQPQLEIYPIVGADPQSVLNVIATLLVGQTNVRLAIDPKTNNLYAHGPPAVQATIRATLDQMQKDKRQFEVIKLRKADPQQVALTLNKLMGGTEEGPAANGPKIEADAINMQLHVRGTMNQIDQIRSFLEKMGEDGSGVLTIAEEDRGNVRMIPLTGRAARSAIDTLNEIWSTTHRNQIRVVTPSSLHQFSKPQANLPRDAGRAPPRDDVPRDEGSARPNLPPVPAAPDAKPANEAPEAGKLRADNRSIQNKFNGRLAFVSQPGEQPAEEKPAPADATEEKKEATDATPETESVPSKKPSVPGADIVITLGPNGILIASEDLEALDELENLLRAIAETALTKGREFNIIYLKYARADAAAEILQEALGAKVVESSSGGGGGGGLLGDMAANMLGGGDGGLLGGLLGLGGGGGGGSPPTSSTSSSAISILPDLRLNALIVQASARDLDSIEHLLQVIDQPASPEKIETIRPPRMIPVLNTEAEQVAAMVKEVYAGRIQAAPNQQRQPSPQELIQALRGGGGRGGRGGGAAAEKKNEEQKISVAVDTRSNSLIVSAPDHLFEEIKSLVAVLDQAVEDTDQAVRVVTLSRASPDLVQRSITSVFGDTVTTSRTAASSTPPTSNSSRFSGQSFQGRSNSGTRSQSGRQNSSQQGNRGSRGGSGRGGR